MTNARFAFVSQAAGRAPAPLDHTYSTSQTVRSSRAGIRIVPHVRRASVCGSAAALRSGCVRYALLCAFRSTGSLAPLADTQTEAECSQFRRRIHQSASDEFGLLNQWLKTGEPLGREDVTTR